MPKQISEKVLKTQRARHAKIQPIIAKVDEFDNFDFPNKSTNFMRS